MNTDEKLAKLQKYIIINYDSTAGARTPLWSHGNSDDVFYDGEQYGKCMALWRIAGVIGMDVPDPDEQDWD